MVKIKKRKLKLGVKVLFIFIAIVVIACLSLGIISRLKKETDKDILQDDLLNQMDHLSLIMVGDALIHSGVYDDAYEDGVYNFNKMLDPVRKIIEKYDLAFYNQETILGGVNLGLSGYPAFNSPQEVGEAFVAAGFNLVSLANNHTLDRGKTAIISANNYWKTHRNVVTSGSYNSLVERNTIQIHEKNGIKYTLLAYTTTTNGIQPSNNYYVNVYDKEQVSKDIEQIKEEVDLLLVSMHWGEEYNTDITNEQLEIAKYLSSLGVDIIIGHHPHVVEPIDYIGDTLVIYSLGNFLSGQEGIERQIGLMVSVDIEKNDQGIIISEPTAMLTYTYYNHGITKSNFKVYPFDQLNNSLLPGYKSYYNTYMDIVTSKTSKVIKSPI